MDQTHLQSGGDNDTPAINKSVEGSRSPIFDLINRQKNIIITDSNKQFNTSFLDASLDVKSHLQSPLANDKKDSFELYQPNITILKDYPARLSN